MGITRCNGGARLLVAEFRVANHLCRAARMTHAKLAPAGGIAAPYPLGFKNKKKNMLHSLVSGI